MPLARRGVEQRVHAAVVAALPRAQEALGDHALARTRGAAPTSGPAANAADGEQRRAGSGAARAGGRRRGARRSPRPDRAVGRATAGTVSDIDRAWDAVSTGSSWASCALLALFGYAQGFLAGALVAGRFRGRRVRRDAARAAAAAGRQGLAVRAAVRPRRRAAGGRGARVGLRGDRRATALRAAACARASGVVDGLLGAVLMAASGSALAWVVGAVALQTPGARELRRDIQRSAILTAPQRRPAVARPAQRARALRPVPAHARAGRGRRRARPTPRHRARPAGARGAPDSVVKILGTACGLGVEGSGWVAAPGIVVTNAHVVAGPGRHAPAGGPSDADRRALRRRATTSPSCASPGSAAARCRWRATRSRATQRGDPRLPARRPLPRAGGAAGRHARGAHQDAYGRGPIRRAIVALRGLVQPGNSGGPVVDGRGRVVATVFAATTSGPRGGYGVPNARVREALARLARAPSSTGPCAR